MKTVIFLLPRLADEIDYLVKDPIIQASAKQCARALDEDVTSSVKFLENETRTNDNAREANDKEYKDKAVATYIKAADLIEKQII